MFQRVTLIGNLGSDPELRYTQSGTPVCGFSVATNEVWTDQQGQRQERTTWWRISAWGRTGEVCNQYLSKGRRVYVEGTVVAEPETGSPRIWTDQHGQPRASFELRATAVKFLDGRSEVDSADEGARNATPARQAAPARPTIVNGPAGSQRRSTTTARQAPPAADVDDEGFGPDEIPF
ncbi:MAG: single-stranded DNA-binding protein [Ardenticatenaceae bacterium]|nr:single-stranded DNA-binding protein [Ardenticatenaceae bacterium]